LMEIGIDFRDVFEASVIAFGAAKVVVEDTKKKEKRKGEPKKSSKQKDYMARRHTENNMLRFMMKTLTSKKLGDLNSGTSDKPPAKKSPEGTVTPPMSSSITEQSAVISPEAAGSAPKVQNSFEKRRRSHTLSDMTGDESTTKEAFKRYHSEAAKKFIKIETEDKKEIPADRTTRKSRSPVEEKKEKTKKIEEKTGDNSGRTLQRRMTSFTIVRKDTRKDKIKDEKKPVDDDDKTPVVQVKAKIERRASISESPPTSSRLWPRTPKKKEDKKEKGTPPKSDKTFDRIQSRIPFTSSTDSVPPKLVSPILVSPTKNKDSPEKFSRKDFEKSSPAYTSKMTKLNL